MENDEYSLILEALIELQEKYKNKKCYLSAKNINDLRNKKAGWFGTKTVWNHHSRQARSTNLQWNYDDNGHIKYDDVIFGLKAGVIFTTTHMFIYKFGDTYRGNGELFEKNVVIEKEFPFKRNHLKTHPKLANENDWMDFRTSSQFYEYLCSQNSQKNIYIRPVYSRDPDRWRCRILKFQKPNILILGGLVDVGKDVNDEWMDLSTIGVHDNKLIINPDFDWVDDDVQYIILHDMDEVRFFEEFEFLVEEKIKNQANHFKSKIDNIIVSIDKDGNGEVDDVEGNDLNTLLKKHQKTLLEIDRNYVKKFVKISTYLKDKKANIQDLFSSIRDTPNESVLNEYVGILKNEVNTYHMILANGLTMLVALIEDDVITYEEIYESMDRINIFDSQWEKDLSQKLSDIGDGLNSLMNEIESLMYEIEASNRRIVNELSNLTYATEQGFSELNGSITKELQSIDSSINFNNLLTGIQTYQMYKINKNTKSLRE